MKLDSWLQLDTTDLIAEKEVLPVGRLTRWVGDDRQVLHADIKQPFIERVANQFKKFKEVGVRVPIFKTHREDPDNKRGEIIDAYVKPNKQGVPSLHVKAKFDNAEAMRLAFANEVSAMLPPKFVDGKNNTYEYPLRHVAITANPVIPGLDGWEGPVVLSFSSESGLEPAPKGEPKVSKLVQTLMGKLGITAPDGANEDACLQLALDKVDEVQSACSLLNKGEKKDEKKDEKLPEGEMTLSFPPVILGSMKKSRISTVDALVLSRDITPAIGDDLKKTYCTDEVIKADLSLSTEETEFDRQIELAKKMAKARPMKTSRETLKLDREGETNPILADAKRRAESSKK